MMKREYWNIIDLDTDYSYKFHRLSDGNLWVKRTAGGMNITGEWELVGEFTRLTAKHFYNVCDKFVKDDQKAIAEQNDK